MVDQFGKAECRASLFPLTCKLCYYVQGAKLAQIPRIMEAGLDAKVVLLKSGDSIATWDGEDIKQLNSAVIEELARSHSQKQLQDTGLLVISHRVHQPAFMCCPSSGRRKSLTTACWCVTTPQLWEIASVAIPCILVAFVAITVVCFIQERKVTCDNNGLTKYAPCSLFPLN